MATVLPNTKDGKTTSYKFRAFLGKDEAGKQVTRYTTWYVPEDMKPNRAQRAAEKAAELWEQAVKEEYKKDLQTPERVREREIAKHRTEFSDFVLNTWFPICVCDGEHKPTTVDFYRHITNKITEYFRGQLIQNIASADIKKYLVYLRTQYRTKQGQPISDKTIRHHYVIETECDGNEPLADKVKRLIFSDKGVIC